MKILTFVSIMSLPFIVGCSPQATPDETQPTTKHIAKSTELRTIMHKFDDLIFKNYQSELDRDKKRIDYTQEMILVVDDLIENSKALQAISNKQQSEDFSILAKALEVESENLKGIVVNYKTEEIASTLDEINNICTKCHATFR